MRIRIDLAYDGTDFSGWAKQPGRRTVQGEVETALERILRLEEPVRLTVAGRTDAGVHARAQVAHVDIPAAAWTELPGRSEHAPAQALTRRLNAVLPEDIAVHAASPAPEGFDARFSAIWRAYSYRVIFAPDPLSRRYALRSDPLDRELLNAAARATVGEHDFTAFCKARPGATAIRTLQEFSWRTEGQGVVARLRADAFCHNLVRSLVGACITVASGRRDVTWISELLAATERSSEVQVAPPHPLVLEAVGYPPAPEMAARAERARAVRRLDV